MTSNLVFKGNRHLYLNIGLTLQILLVNHICCPTYRAPCPYSLEGKHDIFRPNSAPLNGGKVPILYV